MTDLMISQLNTNKQHFGKKTQSVFDESVIYASDRVHAVAPKGRLLKSSMLSAPKIFVKDTAEDVVALKKAIKDGDSNDYRLGRINDLTLKIGSLAIAGYLFTKKNAPKQRLMELIGFGSFFASMALWPKLFVQTPAKLIHGIDVFQEYEDSQGRKKKFFQDPQYIPWDLLSDKEMDKLGDRLNIPKDVPNRSDLTKEKAHKIALQSNTMWMLSAGFGVPIMSAFICSGVEKLLPKAIDKTNLSISNSALDSLQSKSVDAIKPNGDQVKFFKKFLKTINKETVVNDDLLRNLSTAITPNSAYSQFVYEALQKEAGKEKVSQAGVDALFEKHSATFKHFEIDKAKFDENFSKYIEQPLDVQLKGLVRSLKESGNEQAKYQSFDFAQEFITKKGVVRDSLSPELLEKAKTWNLILAKVDSATRTIESNLALKSANSADALATKHWESFNKALVKGLGLSKKEIDIIKNDNGLALDMLSKKLTTSLKDEGAYKKQFNGLLATFEKFATDFDLDIVEKDSLVASKNAPLISALKDEKAKITKIYSNFAESLRSAGLPDLADRFAMTGKDDAITKASASIYTKIDIPVQSKFSSFSRNLLTLDFFKRKADGTLAQQIKHLAGTRLMQPVNDKMVEDIIKSSEKLLLDGKIGDFLSKMSTTGNGNLDYKVVMDLLFDKNNLSSTTKDLMAKSPKNSELFNTFLTDVHDVVGGFCNRHFRHTAIDGHSEHYLQNDSIKLKSSLFHSMWGDSMTSMVRKSADNISNTAIWNKKFAILGASVAAITVLSQFLFGRINLSQNVSQQKESEVA
ncbi:hypothetical protein J6Q66_01435 [bacterium]|nr:hypothetical protein [bacterium]